MADSDPRMKRPSGLPPAESTARRRLSDPSDEEAEAPDRRPLRPPARRAEAESNEASEESEESEESEGSEAPDESETAATEARPPGLRNMTTSARLRLELAFLDDDDDEEEEEDEDEDSDEGDEPGADGADGRPARPPGLRQMSTSARQRLELALEHDEDVSIAPPRVDPKRLQPSPGAIPFDAEAQKAIRSLMRWVLFCGLLTLTLGTLTGLSYLTGPGSIAHVVVGILSSAVSVWLLAAAWSFRRVLTARQQQHHLVHALGHLRSALLLKSVLVFAAMVLGCVTFSIAGSLLFLLG